MKSWSLLLFASLLSVSTGCGGAMYQASAGTHLDVDGTGHEIDDVEVQKAFEASPQLGTKNRVAFFTYDDARADDVTKALASVPNVASVYQIPTLLVTGKRRYQETASSQTPQELSIKKLRLLAARAHADVLVVFDDGYRGGGANGWALLNILIVPMAFTPWLSNETETYAQAHLIDVRNGYVYGEVTAEEKGGKAAVTIYAPQVKEVADGLWPKVLSGVKTKLAEKMQPGAPRNDSAKESAASLAAP